TVPGITGAIAQIIDNGPINVPTPTGTPLPSPTVPSVPGTKPKPSTTPTPDGNGQKDAPNRSQGGSGQAPNVGRPTHNKKFKAGNLNSKKLVSELERHAKRKAHGKVPGRALDGAPTADNPTFSL